ncbi:MAG: hypothetical protein QOH68_3234, partial [Nocardioidaceae bacterium]|nr:hypothetical protein [Nocardioidaceae bacterium]
QLDINRGLMAIGYVTPDGHRLDGYAPDIETAREGTNLSAETVNAYMRGIRWPISPTYPLIVTVPRPSDRLMHGGFPYREAIQEASAVAPMIYWLNRQPEADLVGAMSYLGQFGKPVIPVGQAYDGSPEGGRPGPPPADEILRFMQMAQRTGALGASFWSWQHASDEIWQAIHGAGEFTQAPAPPSLTPDALGVVQARLHQSGQPVQANGRWDPATREAVRWFQAANGLQPTGELTAQTLDRLGLEEVPAEG